MRRGLFILGILSGLWMFNACTKTATTRTKTTDEPPGNSSTIQGPAARAIPVDCPPGTYPVLTYDFDNFHFHRPKYNCESGFWFCTTGGGGWHIECRPDDPFAKIIGTTAHVWAKELDRQIEIHFPLDLKKDPNYTADDLATFNVDEEFKMYEGVTLKPGNYPVKETRSELVVIVNIL